MRPEILWRTISLPADSATIGSGTGFFKTFATVISEPLSVINKKAIPKLPAPNILIFVKPVEGEILAKELSKSGVHCLGLQSAAYSNST
jgi:hypothetical protein